MAVFRGGATLEAAEAVADADLDTIQSLVDKSLFRVRDAGRFWMLDTIREFAVERLTASAEADELRRRHADYYLDLLRRIAPLFGTDTMAWLARIEPEHDNLRAAIDWLAASGHHELQQRLAGELAEFWYLRGHLAEGRARLSAALAADGRRTAARASALNGAAFLSIEGGGEAIAARQQAEEALSIYEDLGDEWGIAYSHLTIAEALSDAAEWEEARLTYEESRRRFAALGDDFHVLLATRLLAWMHFELGEFAEARAIHEENLERARQVGNVRIVGTTLGALGEYDLREGNLVPAATKLRQAYRIFRDLEHPLEVAVELVRFAWLLARAGHAEAGAEVFGRCLLHYEEMQAPIPAWVRPMHDDCVGEIRAQIDEPTYEAALERGRVLTLDDVETLVREAVTPAAD